MILLIDNYDSFTWNLVQRLGEIDPTVDLRVVRNDKITPEQIEADLVEVAREHARTLDATFLGPIRVGLVHDDRLKDGRIEIEARTVAGAGGTAGSIVRVQDGTRLPLADRTVTIGRLSS